MTSFPPKTSPLEQAIGPTISLVLKILAASTALDLAALLLLDLAASITDGPCQHYCCEDCCGPPWYLRMVARGSIYENDAPGKVVGEVGKHEGAVGEEEVLDGATVPIGACLFVAGDDEEGAEVGDASGEGGGVDLESQVAEALLLEAGGIEVAMVDEDGVATVIKDKPEGGLMAEVKDKEVAGRAAVEDDSSSMEFEVGHVAGGRGGGGIEEECIEDGSREGRIMGDGGKGR